MTTIVVVPVAVVERFTAAVSAPTALEKKLYELKVPADFAPWLEERDPLMPFQDQPIRRERFGRELLFIDPMIAPRAR